MLRNFYLISSKAVLYCRRCLKKVKKLSVIPCKLHDRVVFLPRQPPSGPWPPHSRGF